MGLNPVYLLKSFLLYLENLNLAISKNIKFSFIPGHFYAKVYPILILNIRSHATVESKRRQLLLAVCPTIGGISDQKRPHTQLTNAMQYNYVLHTMLQIDNQWPFFSLSMFKHSVLVFLAETCIKHQNKIFKVKLFLASHLINLSAANLM